MHGRCKTPLLLGLLVLALASPAHAQLASVEAGKMLLVYVDGTQSFLVPHAARTFLNSLASQKALFDYEPETDISVLLLDLQATPAPPPSRATRSRCMSRRSRMRSRRFPRTSG
jgi:hypothetical protein